MTLDPVMSSGTVSEPDPLPAIRHAYRMRDEYQRAELRLNNQLKALLRRIGHPPVGLQHTPANPSEEGTGHHIHDAQQGHADPSFDLLGEHLEKHRDELAKERKRWEKNLVALTKTLAVWPWAENVRGVGALSLGQIIAETGALSLYANPGKVWKRMGLAVFEGKSERRVKDKAQAEAMGYSPRRRKVMYIVADNLVKLNKDGYRSCYDDRKAYEKEHHPELTKGHIDKRAKRYMAKRFLRDLWAEWRAIERMPSRSRVSAQPADNRKAS